MENATETRHKALALNLDANLRNVRRDRRRPGSGPLVLLGRGAAGTVAQTISAYDMAVSDALYGATPRYVSRQRLEAMLDTNS